MSKFLAALGLSTALAAATALPLATQAKAAMNYGGQGVADLQHQMAPVEKAQFFWDGNNWCWYPVGWHGPGWYWCGYDWNNGYGWGGPYGWNGWYVAPYYRYGHRGWWPHRHVWTGAPGPGHPLAPQNHQVWMGAPGPGHPLVPQNHQLWMGAPGPGHPLAPLTGGHMPTVGGPGGQGPVGGIGLGYPHH